MVSAPDEISLIEGHSKISLSLVLIIYPAHPIKGEGGGGVCQESLGNGTCSLIKKILDPPLRIKHFVKWYHNFSVGNISSNLPSKTIYMRSRTFS